MIAWWLRGIYLYILASFRLLRPYNPTNGTIDPPLLPLVATLLILQQQQREQRERNNSNNNNMIVLSAYHQQQPIGRFGIVVPPPAAVAPPPLIQAVRRIYGDHQHHHHSDNNVSRTVVREKNETVDDDHVVRAAAIVYMFVEPPYRGRSVGSLALEVIGYLQATCGCDYTLLVANDKSATTDRPDMVVTASASASATSTSTSSSSSTTISKDLKLVQWYERNGYTCAPEIQDLLGSPNGIYGISMIAPTSPVLPHPACRIQWW
jgi:GNAT superfamily N-acetyltransferase